MNYNDAVLVVIDIQGRLANLMHEASRMHHATMRTIEVAKLFSIPILWTEQAPTKIGPTIPEIAKHLIDVTPVHKMSFSSYGSPEFVSKLTNIHRHHIIIVGLETHVCVFQTVRDLLSHGYQVDVVADAVSARSEFQHDIGLRRMEKLGASITSTEMLFCDLLQTADDPRFKQVMALFRQ